MISRKADLPTCPRVDVGWEATDLAPNTKRKEAQFKVDRPLQRQALSIIPEQNHDLDDCPPTAGHKKRACSE
ncbi:hypothetical protein PGTUg99_010920 [Puccinia graminis f. sp. tritici]|uniref:Uncharacterized protein n=1 Tax=Puccinia graminis f. sp. tritici TaxID=56615 RepID=A0A5B0PCG9_PUCGR|nr:hypothetical protein PGTUg99_010920 [Puccinia graminis f. sp. tritici]